MAFYATRAFDLTENTKEYQLLKFTARTDRDLFCDHESAAALPAKEARKLMIADVWRTHISKPANIVFHLARYIPAHDVA